MKEFPLTTQTFPSDTCYPSTVQKLIDLVASVTTVNTQTVLQPYSVQAQSPLFDFSQNPWFQTQTTLSGYGTPKAVRLYFNGVWKEFSQFSQGDAILVTSTQTISAPWGVSGQTYTFGDTGLPSYTPTFNPTAPEGFKYKIYVGYYS